jgi:GT2 family glycosyltransferase
MLGIVTVLYRSDAVLPGFFESLYRQGFTNFKLYLIDNSPGEESFTLIQQLILQHKAANIVHYQCATNTGIAEGNNIGMKMALDDGCSSVCICNNDIEFSQVNLLSKLVELVETDENVIISPKIYMPGTSKQLLWYAGGKFLWYRGSVWHDGYNQADDGSFNTIRYVDFAPACFLVFSSRVIQQVGFMDPKYFVYVDDADYILRARNAGVKILYHPEFEIVHKVSSSTGGVLSDFGLYYNTRNRVYWIRKFFSGASKYVSLFYIPLQMTWKCLAAGKPKSLSKVLKGYSDGFSISLK